MKGTNDIDLLTMNDYFPFGMPISDNRRSFTAEGYRYSYQGQEKEEDLSWFDFDLRMYDSRIGRWNSPDPYGQHFSPYLAMSNNPVSFIDPNGGTDIDLALRQMENSIEPHNMDLYRDIPVFSLLYGLDHDLYNELINGTNAIKEYEKFALRKGLNLPEIDLWLQSWERDADYIDPFNGSMLLYTWRSLQRYSNIIGLIKSGGTSYTTKGPMREPYTGFWGNVEYYVSDGTEGGVKYDKSGNPLGFAPYGGSPDLIGGIKGGLAAFKFIRSAKNSTNGLRLAQQLASESQMAESGLVIIRNLKHGPRLAQQYGGNATDWVKMSSKSFNTNTKIFETHWYQNLATGMRAEFKTILVKGW